jgi:environmental stress-induced protein Ves
MTPSLHLVRLDDVAPTRWRNGGGATRELAAWPGPGDWIVRASIADVDADGPFSAYPGIERWFAVLDGDGVELAHAGADPIPLRAGDPVHRFRGDDATSCRLLGGRTRDFNLMVRRDAASATVTPLPGGHAATSDWSGCFAVTPVRVRRGDDDAWQALPAFALAWTCAPARLAIDAAPDARGWRIDVTLATAVRR